MCSTASTRWSILLASLLLVSLGCGDSESSTDAEMPWAMIAAVLVSICAFCTHAASKFTNTVGQSRRVSYEHWGTCTTRKCSARVALVLGKQIVLGRVLVEPAACQKP